LFLFDEKTRSLRSKTGIRRPSQKDKLYLHDDHELVTHEVEVEITLDNLLGHVYLTGEIVSVPKHVLKDRHQFSFSLAGTSTHADEVCGLIAVPFMKVKGGVRGVILVVFDKSTNRSDLTIEDISLISLASEALRSA